mgnify:CR=1 FL=1
MKTTMTTPTIKTYSELILLPTFEERFNYLKLKGAVGRETFGFDRYLDQAFYHSKIWRLVRDRIIARDLGCDMGLEGYEIQGPIYVHHMNPMIQKDIVEFNDAIVDPEYLICTSFDTHNAIHYSDAGLLSKGLVERKPNDTCPWRH